MRCHAPFSQFFGENELPGLGEPVPKFSLDCVTGLAGLLLDFADELVPVPLALVEVIVGDIAPGLADLASDLLPAALIHHAIGHIRQIVLFRTVHLVPFLSIGNPDHGLASLVRRLGNSYVDVDISVAGRRPVVGEVPDGDEDQEHCHDPRHQGSGAAAFVVNDYFSVSHFIVSFGFPGGEPNAKGFALDRSSPPHRPVNQQSDDRPDDRADDPGCLEVPLTLDEKVAEKPADKRADQPQNQGGSDAHRVSPGHNRTRQEAGDEPDDQPNDNSQGFPPCRDSETWGTPGGIGSNAFHLWDLAVTFRVDSGNQENIAVLVATGELDLATVEILEAAVDTAINEGFNRIVIDLTAVSFMDSTGMRALLVTSQRLAEENGTLGVVLSGGPVARALAVTGVDRLLELFDNLAAAMA